jgi:arabinofuranosyltransferase
MAVRSIRDWEENKRVIILFVLGFSLALVYFFRKYLTDDAFISFRYLENFLNGHGLVYNIGERVWGYTNFLWTIILAPFVKLGFDPVLISRILGIFFNSASLVLVITFYSKSNLEIRKWGWAAGLLLASSGAFVVQSLSGLETSFFSFLVLLTARSYSIYLQKKKTSQLYWIGILAAAAAMTRPEGYFIFGLLVLHFLYEFRTQGLFLWTSLRIPLLIFGAFMSLFLTWAYLYYSAFWPNSISAKVGMSGEQILRGLHYLKVFAVVHPFPLLILLLSLLFFKRTEVIHRFMIFLSLYFVFFNILVGGDFMIGYRLFHVMITFSYLLLPFVFACLSERIRAFNWKAQSAVYVLIAFILLVNLALSILDPHIRYADSQYYVYNGIKVGKWMRENFEPGTLVATNNAGTIAFYSRLPIVDMMGLNDKVIAHRKDMPKEWKGNEKGYGRYVLARKPDYIMLGPVPGTDVPRWLSDTEIFESKDFWINYRLEKHKIEDTITLVLFKRRSKPRQEPYPPEFWEKVQTIAAAKRLHSKYRY